MSQTKNETNFLQEFISGSHSAFEWIYKKYAVKIYKRLLFLLKNDEIAEEVLQSVFVKLWESRSQIDSERNFGAYVSRIAHNAALDYIRLHIKLETLDEKNQAHPLIGLQDSVEELYIRKEKQRILENAIEQLPAQRRAVFKLCKVEGRSYLEVSEMLAITPATISAHLTLAMKSIRNYVLKHQEEINLLILFWYFFKKK